MASTKFEVSMEIFKFQGEPDVSVTLTGKSPAELDTALKTLETIAKTTTLYNGDSAPEAEKSVTSEPKQAASVVSTADKKAPPKKPVSWLTPVGAKGLMLLPCPFCGANPCRIAEKREVVNTETGEAISSNIGITYWKHPETPDCVLGFGMFFLDTPDDIQRWNSRTDKAKSNPET